MPANSSYSFSPGQILTAADLNSVFAQTVSFAADSSNANTGTLPEARLPYRMDQDVKTTSNVQFKDGVFTGNLTISGTMVYVNTNVLDVKDTNITIAKGAANSSLANGAGIYIDGAAVNLKYDDSTNMMTLDHLLSIGNSTVNAVFGYSSTSLSGGQFVGNVNNYFQVITTNSNTGTSASGDFVVADDTGINSGNYIDMGINSSQWSNTQWTINGPSDSYLYAAGGNLAIGTANNKHIKFFANGTLANSEAMSIDSGANVNIGNTKAGSTYFIVGNGTINVVTNSTSIAIGNNVANTSGSYPESNTVGTALGSSTKRWIINANTINASGLITGTSGMTITGTANASTAMYVGANVYMNLTTFFVGNSTVNTNISAGSVSVNGAVVANNSGVYATGTVNAASYSVGTSLTANATLVNAAAINIVNQVNTATLYAATTANVGGNVQVNTTALFIGNSTVNSTMLAGTLNVNGAFIANNTGAYHSGTINAASHTVGATFTANATLVNAAAINIVGQVNTATLYAATSANIGTATVANATGVYTTGTVDGTSFTVGSTFTANATLVNAAAINVTGQVNTATLLATTSVNAGSNVYMNLTTMFVGNSTVNTNISAGLVSVNGVVIANTTTFQANGLSVNSTGAYVTGTANANSFTTTSVTVNTTAIAVGANVVVNTSTSFVGNSSVNTNITAGQITLSGQTVNSTVFTGLSYTANNSSYLGGTAAANYVQNSGAYTISGVHTYTANIIFSNGNVLIANGSFGSNSQVLISNGTSMYWGMFSANDALSLGGTNAAYFVQNTDSRVLSGNLNFTGANISFSNTTGIWANGGFGSAGQALTTNGSAIYWSTIVGTNTAAQYTWSNTQTFQNTITFSSQINIGSNVVANTSQFFVGNSTINSVYTSTGLTVANGTVTSNIGTLGVYAGANVYMNTTSMFVSTNSTMNTVISANQITLNGANVMTTTSTLKVYYANGTQAFP